jgi:hypothetical protein
MVSEKIMMTLPRVAIAGRYKERQKMLDVINDTHLALTVEIQASWLLNPMKDDETLTEQEAASWALLNCYEIANAEALIYFPSWWKPIGETSGPCWSPGRLIDFGIALGTGKKIIICGKPEPSIYFRGGLVTVCEPDTLVETVKRVLKL